MLINNKMADKTRSEEPSEPEQPLEIEIVYTEQEIAHKLSHYALNQKSLLANLEVNVDALQKYTLLEKEANNLFLIDLKNALHNWPKV